MTTKRIIYILLFISFFSAVLRPSTESPLTLFRLLIPFCLWVIYVVNSLYFKNLIKFSFIFLVIAFIQNFVTREILYPNINTFSYSFLLLFCANYITNFVIISLVYSLWYIEKERFFINSIGFASTIAKLCIALFIVYVIMGGDNMYFNYIGGNINNFGCLMTAGLLAILFDPSTKSYLKYIYIVLIPSLLLYNDSKLALMGAILILVLYAIFRISNETSKKVRKKILIVLSLIFIFVIYKFFTSSSDINGYEVESLILMPLEYIKEGQYFDESTSSIAFRTNSIVGIVQILKKSLGIGVGPGNTSFILTTLMPDREGRFSELDYTSPHIWWLEVMADLGWVIILPSLKYFYRNLRSYFTLKSTNDLLFSQIFVISFPLWCASASSLHTEYYCIMMITISYLLYKKHDSCYMQDMLLKKSSHN